MIFPEDLEENVKSAVGAPDEKVLNFIFNIINCSNKQNGKIDCSFNGVKFTVKPGMLLSEVHKIWKEESEKLETN